MSQLTKKSLGLIARIQEKLPEQQVALVPGDAFFVRKIDLPEGLSRADMAAFIQLDLEGNSPFPMDQLTWGYFNHPDSPHAFAYASPKARLKRLEFDRLDRYWQLFPGFASFFGETTQEPAIRFLSQCGVLSAVFLQAGQSVPVRIVSQRIDGDLLTDDIQLSAREKLATSLSSDGFTLEEGLWLGEGIELLAGGSVRFQHRHVSAKQSLGLKPHELDLPGEKLWAVDLRDDQFAARESAVRQRSRLIWRSLKIAAWAAAFLLVVQVFSFGLRGYDLLLQRKIQQIEPSATRVENKLTLASRLTQSTEEDLKPFTLMEAINPLRPDSIFYERVRSRAYDTLEIEGKSTEGVTPVNAFADSIDQLPYVSSVENNSQTRNNQTSFEFVISFSEIPPEPEGGLLPPEESGEDVPDEEADSQ